jgi:hypothetical protein
MIPSGRGAPFVAGIASLAAQYYLTAGALERLGLREPGGRNRFGAFWGLNILSGLGIALGFLFLILPGIYLSARWAVASVVLLAEDDTVSVALGESWAVTRPNLWAIIATLLVIFVPACLLAFGISIPLYSREPMLAQLILYVFLFAAFVTSWLTAVAIYSLLRPSHEQLAEVFA